MNDEQDLPDGGSVAGRRGRRALALRRRRRRRLQWTVVAVVGLVAASVTAGVLVGDSLTRAKALDAYETSTAEYEEVNDVDQIAQLSVSVTGVRGALAVYTDLETEESVAALSAAATAAEEALARLTSAADWTAGIEPTAADAEVLAATAADADARRVDLAEAQDEARQRVADLDTARERFAAVIRSNGMTLLSDYSDAEKTTEDALYAALQSVSTASSQELPDAVTAVVSAAAAVRTSALDYRAQIAAEATGRQPTGGDVSSQLDYLLTHATSYNLAAWGDYNPSGGDCVNFTSQGLLARGWKMDRTWYSTGPSGGSRAWILTPALDAYLKASGFVAYGADDLDRVRVGDVGIFDWGEDGVGEDHTMTVSKVEYTADGPTIWFASHNSDGEYRELRTALYEEHSDSTVKIYSIP